MKRAMRARDAVQQPLMYRETIRAAVNLNAELSQFKQAGVKRLMTVHARCYMKTLVRQP
jgi:hypothetical protein